MGLDEKKQFQKKELKIFLWVNIGIAMCLAVALIWKYSPLQNYVATGCPFHDFLHLYCPGCGGTRAVYLLLSLHPIQSVLYHPIVVFVSLLLVEYYAGAVVTLIKKDGKRYYYMRDWFCYVALGIVLTNWIMRNLLMIIFHIDYIGDLVQFWN